MIAREIEGIGPVAERDLVRDQFRQPERRIGQQSDGIVEPFLVVAGADDLQLVQMDLRRSIGTLRPIALKTTSRPRGRRVEGSREPRVELTARIARSTSEAATCSSTADLVISIESACSVTAPGTCLSRKSSRPENDLRGRSKRKPRDQDPEWSVADDEYRFHADRRLGRSPGGRRKGVPGVWRRARERLRGSHARDRLAGPHTQRSFRRGRSRDDRCMGNDGKSLADIRRMHHT